MRSIYAIGCASLFWSVPCLATTYQVGPTRSLTTLNAVASKLAPGDVVEVDGDATYAGGIVLARPGAAGNPITIKGVYVNGKRPVLSGGANTIEIQGDHYVLQGFEITAATTRCVYHHSDDVTMRDLVVHDCQAHGLLGADQDSGSLTLEYSEFYGSGSGTNEHQIYMATDEVAHPGSVFRMQFCYVHGGKGGNNVKSRAERNEIYYNWIEGAVYHELELIGPDPSDAADGWTEDLKREDSDVVGNVLRKTQTSFVTRFGGDGDGQTNGRYRFVANTVLTQPGGSAVFRLFDGIESVEMHDNVFFVDPNPSGAATIVRDSEAVWSTGMRIVGGSHNWVVSQASAVPPEWTVTLKGTNPQLANISSFDLSPVASGPLADGCTCISSPPGYDFPNPLPWPAFEPPRHLLEAPGTAIARSVSGQLYIGAYQPDGSSGGSTGAGGTTSTGGTTSAGGTTSTGGTTSANGGSGSGGVAKGGATSTGGSAASGGTTTSGGTTASGAATGAGGVNAAGGTTSSGTGGATSSGAGGASRSNGGGTSSNGGSTSSNGGSTSSNGGSTLSSGGTAPVLSGSGSASSSAGNAETTGSGGSLDDAAASSGCTCRVAENGSRSPRSSMAWGAAASLVLLAKRRRRSTRR
ncbi:MAG TPA: hypothetical protein VHC69_07535 [Polyangiaceae bacterium]|nr:hypothetical protein [Polyangiaceae bacterium]